jgi:glycosyltransferase involved in cell wall biosynthesis
MPNYNDARFLRESVPAILSQSYPHLQVLVVDDGSTDDSAAYLAGLAKTDPRLRVILNGRNLGSVVSVERAQAEATGEYIYFASADDRVLPGFFEKCVRELESRPKAGLCWTDPCHFFEDGGAQYGRGTALSSGPAYFSPDQVAEFYRSGRLTAPMHAAPALLRRKVYLDAGGFLPALRWYCDFFVTLVMVYRTGMCYLPEALTSTRVQERSYSRAGSAQKEVQRDVLTTMLNLLLSPTYRDLAAMVRSSGVLSYFGTPIYRLIQNRPEYNDLLAPEFRSRARYYSFKHGVRRMMGPGLQRAYFSVRGLFRKPAAPGA